MSSQTEVKQKHMHTQNVSADIKGNIRIQHSGVLS